MCAAELNKNHLAVICENCKSSGYILVEDMHLPVLVVCPQCGGEISYAWCDNCKQSGNFVDHLEIKPGAWVCPHCKSQYFLPNDFYQKPARLYTDSEDQFGNQENAASPGSRLPKQVIYLIALLAVLEIGLDVFFIFMNNFLAIIITFFVFGIFLTAIILRGLMISRSAGSKSRE